MLDYDVLKFRPRGIRLICDICNKKYSRFNNYNRILNKTNNFCSHECSNIARKKGNLLNLKIVATNRKKYNSDYGLQSEKIIIKARKTCISKYGVSHPAKLDSEKQKRKNTCIRKYGKTSYLATDDSRNAMQAKSITLYGTPYPLQSDAFKKSLDWNKIAKKRHETMKRNGVYKKIMSKPEAVVYDLLIYFFGKNNVEHQEVVNDRWSIDFYIKTKNVYIQVDGIYWHGLDRSLDVIKEFKNLRDKVIYKKYVTDRKQDEWFKENNLMLIRFTDYEAMNGIENIKQSLRRFTQ